MRNAASDPEFHAMAGGSGGRIALLPVQWRKGLNLGVRLHRMSLAGGEGFAPSLGAPAGGNVGEGGQHEGPACVCV